MLMLAWAAGFIDGEGSFLLSPVTNIFRQHMSYIVALEASNTDLRPLNRLLEIFGGRISIHNKGNIEHSTSYKWRIHGANAALVAERLLPYLTVKYAQAEIAIQYQATIKRRSEWGVRGVPEDIRQLRAELKQKITELNSRGPNRKRA